MKRQLTDEDRNALVAYRINRSHETMKEAKYVADSGFYYAAINRLYYPTGILSGSTIISGKAAK